MLFVFMILFVIGIAILLFGANKLTDNAAHLAHQLGIHPIVIGMTILAIGTSFPEMANTSSSMLLDVPVVGFGDILGSDFVQITLILGIVSLIRPLYAQRKELLIYGIATVSALVLALIVVSDGVLNWIDGIILCIAYISFIWYLLKTNHIKKNVFKKKHNLHWVHVLSMLFLSLIVVILGSRLVVYSTTQIATLLSFPAYLVAFLVVGLGTSLPELVVSANAVYKKNVGLGVGTLLGSNVTDPTLSLGFGALFTKGVVVPSLIITHLYILIGVTIFVIGIFAWRKKISRLLAILFILLYFVGLFFFF